MLGVRSHCRAQALDSAAQRSHTEQRGPCRDPEARGQDSGEQPPMGTSTAPHPAPGPSSGPVRPCELPWRLRRAAGTGRPHSPPGPAWGSVLTAWTELGPAAGGLAVPDRELWGRAGGLLGWGDPSIAAARSRCAGLSVLAAPKEGRAGPAPGACMAGTPTHHLPRPQAEEGEWGPGCPVSPSGREQRS